MVLRRLGILGAIAILPAMAQVSKTSSHADLLKKFQAQHGPMKLLVQHEDGSVESTNWSGYAVTGKNFTQAEGSWIEPTIICNKKSDVEIVAAWVGLDGYNDDTVEQTGTLAICSDGQVEHIAWWELYPLNSIQEINSITVSPGDKISTSVKYNAKTKKYAMKITDETTGKTFTKTATQAGTERASAEWIVEAPCCAGSSVYPLPKFGTITLGKDTTSVANTNYAKDKTHSGAFNTFPSADVFAITMVNAAGSHPVEASPSAPSSDGSSFSVLWVSP
jgi:hypothetical protein